MVTVTVDPASTRDGSIDLRSSIYFDNCTFNGGLTILGDYHAMVSLGGGGSFGAGAIVTCKEVTSGAGENMGLEDNFVKVFISCEDVTVETEYAVGVVADGSDFVFSGTTYSMVSLGGGCSFGDGATVTCKEVTPGAGEDMGLEDNFVKVFVSCEDVTVETEYAVGVVTDGPDFVFNGTTYSKEELAPDAAILGVYSICENDGMSYMKLAIGEDDSIEVLD